jgi:phenylacetate-CoA ligase
MNSSLLRRVILPAWQQFKGQNSLKVLPSLETSQWLPLNELIGLQWHRLGGLLEHAYQHVPYYRTIMRDSEIVPTSIVRQRSLEMLPLLSRAIITQQITRLRATNLPADRFVPNGTGGSTGEPLRFFDDYTASGWLDAAVWRSHRWCGVDVGDRCCYLWGANFDLTRFQGLSGRMRSRALNLLMLPAWKLGEATSEDFWKKLVDFRPKLLVAYSGAIYNWARLLGDDRDPIPDLRAIIVSAETLHEEWREVIERCFKVPVYNRYGGRDIKFIAQECPKREGLHINAENVFVEIVKGGRSVAPGEVGEVVVTRLDNFAMPFIRYQTGDLAIMASSACECGRSLPLLKKIEGRIQDTIVTLDGRIVSGPFFAHMIKDCPDVKEFQVHQLTRGQLLVQVVLNDQRRFSSQSRIERLVREYMGHSMRIDFDVRDSIPLTRSGKRRVIVSHLSVERAAPSADVGKSATPTISH